VLRAKWLRRAMAVRRRSAGPPPPLQRPLLRANEREPPARREMPAAAKAGVSGPGPDCCCSSAAIVCPTLACAFAPVRRRGAGSGSRRCGASDGDVPVATREVQHPNSQEEGCPSVDGVRKANDARGGRDKASGNTRYPKGSEVAVLPWVDQALHAGSRGSCPPPAKTFPSGAVLGCVHRGRAAHARFRNLR